MDQFEVIDAKELSARLRVPVSWIQSYSRERTPRDQRIPHLKFGHYTRYEWGSPALENWLSEHREGSQ